jgi:DNA-binding SARP family transcriptional activator/predicted ATPase
VPCWPTFVSKQRRPHRRERLAGLLWPDLPEQAARTNLRHALANVRQVIGDQQAAPPFLIVTRKTIQFNTSSDAWVDALAFLGALDATGRPIPQLEGASAWYRGEFLRGFSLPDSEMFGEWLLLQRERFQRLYLEALERLVQGHTLQGEYQQALDFAWRQVELDPLRESAYRQLMRLLAYVGRTSEAVSQYETCRHLLDEELGVEPSEETALLYEEIRNGKLKVPPRSVPSCPPHNLPASLTPFVGRETEIAETQDLLQDPACRILTLVGPGGIGKTRLALEVGRRQVENYSHGVYMLHLAELQSVEAIVPAAAAALGICLHEQAEPRQQLVDYLRAKTMLLILDSFEHLLAPSGSAEDEGYGGAVVLVLDLLRAASGVTLLVTSRTRLNLTGEQVYPVGGLGFPESDAVEEITTTQYGAVQLFLTGARRVRPGFQLEGQENHVARICQLLQGMPLGILLAASWLGLLTPAEIATRVAGEGDSQEPAVGLSLLEADWHDLPKRQRSLRAVFDHSWNLLAEREREVCQALSVFSGGFAWDAAEKVAGASLRELRALVDKSLLHHVSPARYEIHELVRQYAADRLRRADRLRESSAAWESVHDRHSAYYALALRRWETDLRGPRQRAALSEMELESKNIGAAWQWAVKQGQIGRMAQAMDGLALFYWLRRRHKEGEAAMQAAASTLAAKAGSQSTIPSDTLRPWIRALVWRSDFCRRLGRREQVTQLHQQAMALLEGAGLAEQTLSPGPPQDIRFERALLLQSMGCAVFMSDYRRGRQLHEESLALFRELDDRWRMASALDRLGRAAYHAFSPAEARQHRSFTPWHRATRS